MTRIGVVACLLGAIALAGGRAEAAGGPAKRVALIAGTKSHGPGDHEYERGMRLLKACLEAAPNLAQPIKAEVYTDGWPRDPGALDGVDTVVMFCDGSDHDVKAHPLLRPDRLAMFDRLMKRGVGFVAIHYTVFVPTKLAGDRFLDAIGGYFDYENGAAANKWYSKIRTATFPVAPATKGHPIARGIGPFSIKEEYYYNIRFRPNDERLVPILSATVPGEANPQVVAWAVERADGGRGFGYTGGHFHTNWGINEARKLILNAIVWTAKAEVPKDGVASSVPPDALKTPPPSAGISAGRFGQAIDAPRGTVGAASKPEYREPPLTVECWARLNTKRSYNLLVAHAPKESAAHWEIYSNVGDGSFHAYVPGMAPAIIDSRTDIVDGRWHYLAFVFEPRRARLYVDAKQVADVALTPDARPRAGGPLWFGAYPPGGLGCDGQVDEVRLSRGVRAIERVPDAPFAADATTIGLWHFDGTNVKSFDDASPLKNPAVAAFGGPAKPGPSGEGTADYRVADPRLKVLLLDRSPDESFLSIRGDTEGRIFVGGREAVFVYEPAEAGGYRPRRLLYRFPPHTWVTDMEVRGDDLYVMTMSAIYVLPGGRTRREGLAPKRLIWGIPVDLHVTMHGLAFGPEGDLYYATGDPLLNYGDFRNRADHWGHWTLFTQPEGTRVPYTGQGGVFRVLPDGSGLRVLARGLRGADGLAFDRRWELFTNDNDHESLPADYVPARLLHATPHADFGWPRGWMASKTPDRADVLETLVDGLGREVPVGQAYYDEPLLPAEYRDSLLVARWAQRRVDAFHLVPRGASFRAVEHPLLVATGTARPVGVAVGRGGRVFAALCYMQNNETSPTYVSDLVMITRADDPTAQPFDGYDATAAKPERLWSELSNPAFSRRRPAHLEILRRGGDFLAEATRRLERIAPDDPAVSHLPWLAGASGSVEAHRILTRRLGSPDASVRLQAIRALLAFPALGAPREAFVKAIKDPDPGVQLAAIAALFDRRGPIPDALVRGPARSTDSYLRQTSASLLADQAPSAELEALCRSNDPATRLAGVLAAGTRLTVPPALGALPDDVPLHYSATNALFTLTYADRTINLRDLGRIGSFTVAERWKAESHTKEQGRLFGLLLSMLDDPEDAPRLQAAYYLKLLNDPRSEPRVDQARRETLARRLARLPRKPVARAWALGPLPDSGSAARPENGPIDLSTEYETAAGRRTWQVVTPGAGEVAPTPPGTPSSSYLYFRLQSPRNQTARLLSGVAEADAWHNGRPVAVRDGEATLELQSGSNDVLIRFRGTSKWPALSYCAEERVVDVLPEKLGLATLAERLKAGVGKGGAAEVPSEFLATDWSRAVAEGDPERGRKLFGPDALGCARCHAVTPEIAVSGGPSLAGAAKRFTVAHVVESVLLPSKQVAPIFRASTIATTDGRVLTGLVLGESDAGVELLLPDATRTTIPRKEIEERRPQDVSPMPAGLVKTPAELRDLLAYLFGEHPKAP